MDEEGICVFNDAFGLKSCQILKRAGGEQDKLPLGGKEMSWYAWLLAE